VLVLVFRMRFCIGFYWFLIVVNSFLIVFGDVRFVGIMSVGLV